MPGHDRAWGKGLFWPHPVKAVRQNKKRTVILRFI
jgi:hypothetical protein